MNELQNAAKASLKTGLIMGLVAMFVALTGIMEDFNQLQVIGGVIALGQTIMLLIDFAAGYVAARGKARGGYPGAGLLGAGAGLFTAGLLALLVLLIDNVNIRPIFVNATETLVALLTFERSLGVGILLLLAVGMILGGVGGILSQLPSRVRAPLLAGLTGVLLFGILQEIFTVLLSSLGLPKSFINFLFRRKGLSPVGARLLFVLFAGFVALRPVVRPWMDRRLKTMSAGQKAALRFVASIAGLVVLGFLPHLLKLYWTDVIDNVGLFILMGLGLNIVVGLAGLLDLGYVAFYAIGAYAVGTLTSPRSFSGVDWSFWPAWPVAFVIAALAGVILGVPVLRMRGDYLAIVTLGFGEIIRVLALSDLLKPYFGGAQGILEIPKPHVAGLTLLTSQHLYYLILAGCLVTVFVSWRLKDSRVGRAWIAIREDEDVAQAMGINLVKYKLLAFAIGALFAGVSGAIFASKLSSIYPHSFNVIVSINVLCLIIVGGVASIPGVIVGAVALVGLPEVLRFAAEYRYMVFGAALVVMMLVRPEGLWPAARRRRELRAKAEIAEGGE
jgi:branched-chain amino acid transport system permease protein